MIFCVIVALEEVGAVHHLATHLELGCDHARAVGEVECEALVRYAHRERTAVDVDLDAVIGITDGEGVLGVILCVVLPRRVTCSF